jgi:hypothetical protein
MIQGDALADRFEALGAFLKNHEALWKPRPFTHASLGWESAHPELAGWLRGRALAEAEQGLQAPLHMPAPAPFPTLAKKAAELADVGALPTMHTPDAPSRLSRDVPGRKWQQIEAFARHLHFQQAPAHWLDWCSGKGHLGRRLASLAGQQLTCYEYDPALVTEGQLLSDRHGLPAQHRCVDVMAEDTCLPAISTPVALHACGDLHLKLLQLAVRSSSQSLAVAPCCYNRTQAAHYVPLSRLGKSSGLALSQADLGLPASEAVTAGARVLRQRDVSMARRLAFDNLQRSLRDTERYLPTPSLPTRWLAQPLEAYCRHLAGLKGLTVPDAIDWASLEVQGWARLAEVRNLELPRALFRRPLEVWLVLDRALWLAEQGYCVQIGTFCDPAITPRNLLILAEKR